MGNEPVCKSCWSKCYHPRAIILPVAGPVLPLTWEELRKMLASSWGDSTRLSNWVMTEFAKAEKVRMPSNEKLWKPDLPYLYPHARSVCPNLSSQSVVSLINSVQSRFLSSRLDVVWLGSSSLPSYKYPVPYPLPSQAWSVRWLSETEKVPIVSVTLNGVRCELRLRCGHEFARPLMDFAKLVTGEALPCEMAIYRKAVSPNDNRIGINEAKNGGGESRQYRVMVKLVAWIPIENNASVEKVLTLRRGDDCLWIAETVGRDPWRLNCEWVKTWIQSHAIRLQRISEDCKYEKRWPSRNRMHIGEYREMMCKRQNDRLKTFSHTASKMLAEYAVRNGVGTIIYDEKPSGYLPKFPWFELREMLAHKLRERRIALEVCDGAREC